MSETNNISRFLLQEIRVLLTPLVAATQSGPVGNLLSEVTGWNMAGNPASNTQLLRLHKVVQAVKDKWGSRDALITAIGTATNKSKDKDYLAKLAKFSLPRLYDLATSATRRARE